MIVEIGIIRGQKYRPLFTLLSSLDLLGTIQDGKAEKMYCQVVRRAYSLAVPRYLCGFSVVVFWGLG